MVAGRCAAGNANPCGTLLSAGVDSYHERVIIALRWNQLRERTQPLHEEDPIGGPELFTLLKSGGVG